MQIDIDNDKERKQERKRERKLIRWKKLKNSLTLWVQLNKPASSTVCT